MSGAEPIIVAEAVPAVMGATATTAAAGAAGAGAAGTAGAAGAGLLGSEAAGAGLLGAEAAGTAALGAEAAPVVGAVAPEASGGLLGLQESIAAAKATPLMTTTSANPLTQLTAQTFAQPAMSMAPVEPASGLMGAIQNAQGELASQAAMSVSPYGMTNTFTLGDALGKAKQAGSVMGSMNKQGQQQQAPMMDGGSQRMPMRSFAEIGAIQPHQNNFARMLMQRRMGLLG